MKLFIRSLIIAAAIVLSGTAENWTWNGFLPGISAYAQAAGININTVTESTPATVGSANCNWAISPYCRVSATATALTALTFSNPSDGTAYIFEFDQDSTGEPATLPTGTAGIYAPDGATTMPSIQTVASQQTIYQMVYNGTLGKYIVQNTPLTGIPNYIHNNCTDVVTLSSGIFATTGAGACFTNYSRIGWNVFAGSPTGAVLTPTAVAGNVQCAMTAANGQSLNCTSSAAADARVVVVYGIN